MTRRRFGRLGAMLELVRRQTEHDATAMPAAWSATKRPRAAVKAERRRRNRAARLARRRNRS